VVAVNGVQLEYICTVLMELIATSRAFYMCRLVKMWWCICGLSVGSWSE